MEFQAEWQVIKVDENNCSLWYILHAYRITGQSMMLINL